MLDIVAGNERQTDVIKMVAEDRLVGGQTCLIVHREAIHNPCPMSYYYSTILRYDIRSSDHEIIVIAHVGRRLTPPFIYPTASIIKRVCEYLINCCMT